MKEKFKEFRDGLSLGQVKKITAVVTVVFEIILLIAIVSKWEELVQNFSRGTGDKFGVVVTLGLTMLFLGIGCIAAVYLTFDGMQKEIQEKMQKMDLVAKEKFKLQSSEYTEIILDIKSLQGGSILKMLTEIEKKADIKYFACMSEDGEKYFIICKMLEEVIYEIKSDNWLFLEANFEPKKTEDETTET